MSKTLLDALEWAAPVTERGWVFVGDDGRESFCSLADTVAAARRRGRQLRGLGLAPGERVALVLPRAADFVTTFLGAAAGGLTPVPLAPPISFGALDAYVRGVAAMVRQAECASLVTERRLAPLFWRLRRRAPSLRRVLTVSAVDAAVPAALAEPAVAAEDAAFIQFTSGSTSTPRGVVVSHRALMANSGAILSTGLGVTERDVGVSWLPLYHDMGLIGFGIVPVLTRAHVVLIPPLRFLKRPNVWLETVDRHRATLTFAPNFGLALAARRAGPEHLARWNLSCLRAVGCGAEPIHAAVLRRFEETFARCGLSPEALLPCYGLAESTLAVTFKPLGEPFRIDRIDATRLSAAGVAEPVARGGEARALEVVCCGRPFPGHELRIVDDQGRALPDRRVGHIVLRGPSLASGYVGDEEGTGATFRDGWLHTGDVGYLADGQLYVSGRVKDLVILNGRNHHPADIEWVAGQVEGVRRGNVVACSRPGVASEELVILAEVKEDRGTLAEEIRRRIGHDLGLVVADVKLVPAGALPKTTSGKLRRGAARAQYLDGSLTAASTMRAVRQAGPARAMAGFLARSLWDAMSERKT